MSMILRPWLGFTKSCQNSKQGSSLILVGTVCLHSLDLFLQATGVQKFG